MGVAGKATHQRALYSIIVLLTGYVAVDLLAHHTSTFPVLAAKAKLAGAAGFDGQELENEEEEPALCRTLEGHLDVNITSSLSSADAASYGDGDGLQQRENPWSQMKWVGPPGTCRVKGLLIEKLEPSLNFRRGFALKYAGDVEDKAHILPWLLATRVKSLHRRERRVLLDLGANAFSTSLSWFLHMYPLDFTEIHAFEVDPHLLHKPKLPFHESSNLAPPNPWSLAVRRRPLIGPQWMLDRISIHHQFVSDFDDGDNHAVNITRFIKDELQLRPSDAVIVKMDIEGSEWPILKRWMQTPDMAHIVDELFVEVHYDHPSMRGYHWARFSPTKREDALTLLANLRLHGFFAHAWP
ncbi:hypothetical protein L7F22_029933 [Adiantum nelumboides]|nr:hypothetical protein [Adiantum nelumboides]